MQSLLGSLKIMPLQASAYNDAMDDLLDYHIKKAGPKKKEKLKLNRCRFIIECTNLNDSIQNENSNMKSINENDVKDLIKKLNDMKAWAE